ncbi:MAG: RES family NAD+ phosphorylase [Clostridia bacterium]|nr:RES family NAD+ phosphorylase [Clostridia bacterium]
MEKFTAILGAKLMGFDEQMRLTESDWKTLLKYDTWEYLNLLRKLLSTNRNCILPLLNKILYNFAFEDFSQWYSQSCLEPNFYKLYRARIYTKPIVKELENNPFQGYDEKNSFVPPANSIKFEGRVNKRHQVVLYAASSPQGAIAEINPNVGNVVSVATIEITRNLHLFNMAHTNMGIEAGTPQKTNWIQKFILDLAECFYSVHINKEDYYLSQYVGSYIKTLGFDGIRYFSSKNESNISETANFNYAILNYDKCKAVSSKKYYVAKVAINYFEFN